MRFLRPAAMLTLLLFTASLRAQAPEQPQKITVAGKLTRVMAIGAESTGWSIELDSSITVDGKDVHAIQVSYANTGKLEKLENKHVAAVGKVSNRHGVETGDQPVLNLSSIKETKIPALPDATPPKS